MTESDSTMTDGAKPPGSTVTLTAGGLHWVAEPDFAPALSDLVVPVLRSHADQDETTVKRSLSRAVYHVPIDGDGVYVKHHHPRSGLERLKYLVLRSRAQAEWTAARTMLDRGIPVARPLAFGERRVAGFLREAALVSEAVDNAAPLSEALGRAGRSDLIEHVAGLVRRMHDNDILHRDLHGGNILVRGDDLFLIDVHRVTINRPVRRRARAWNLGQLIAFLGDRMDEADHERFIRAYLGTDATPEKVDRLDVAAHRQAEKIRERRYVSRTKRCIKKSTGFRRERVDGMTIYRRADIPTDAVTAAIEQHHSTVADEGPGEMLKSDGRTRVTRVPARANGGGPLCVKEFRRPGILKRIHDRVRGSPARRAWIGSNACRVRGIPTPRAAAMAEDGPRSYFISRHIEGAVSLYDYVTDHCRPEPGGKTRRWRRFVRKVADFVRDLDRHRLWHRDLASKNVLVRESDDGWQIYLIDIGDIRRGRTPSFERRLRNLAQIGDAWVRPTRTDRLRFLRRFAAGDDRWLDRDVMAKIDAISRDRNRYWEDDIEMRQEDRQGPRV
ncbi:MAG: lipopolysaccharide kinase InaA family protein [Planctomycetota bacterium]